MWQLPWARKPVTEKARPQTDAAFGVRFGNDPATSRFVDAFRGAIDHPHPTLLYQRSKAGAGYRSAPVDLLVEEIEKDPYIMGLIDSRVNNVMHMDDAVLQADQTKQAIRASKLIDRVDDALGGFTQLMSEALRRAIPFGISVHEVVWGEREFPLPGRTTDAAETEGKWVIPVALQQVRPNRIGFDGAGRLMLRCDFRDANEAAAAGCTASDDADWWYPDPINVLVFTRYSDFDSPYGYPLLATLFYLAWFKRQMLIWWAQYNDRYTTPLHEIYASDREATLYDEDKLAIRNFLLNIQRHTSFRPPPGWKLDVHELMASGAINTFQNLIQLIDDQAAVLLVGQTSTSTNAPQGSQSSSQVHERNALAIYGADARAIEGFVNRWFQMIVEFNLGKQARYKCPKLNINTKSAAEVSKWVNDVMLPGVTLGAKVPVREFFRVTGLDEAQDGEETLKLPEPPVAAGAPGMKPPSQRPAQKTPARARQRERKAAPKSQVQPRSQQ